MSRCPDRLPARADRRAPRRRAFDQLGAEVHHHEAVDQPHHEVHVVLDQQDGHALAAQPRSSSASACFSARRSPAAGSSSTSSTGSARSARAISRMRCVAERQIAGQFVQRARQARRARADAAPRHERALLRRGRAAASPPASRTRPRDSAPSSDVVEQRSCSGRSLHVLEGARDARAAQCARCAGR